MTQRLLSQVLRRPWLWLCVGGNPPIYSFLYLFIYFTGMPPENTLTYYCMLCRFWSTILKQTYRKYTSIWSLDYVTQQHFYTIPVLGCSDHHWHANSLILPTYGFLKVGDYWMALSSLTRLHRANVILLNHKNYILVFHFEHRVSKRTYRSPGRKL